MNEVEKSVEKDIMENNIEFLKEAIKNLQMRITELEDNGGNTAERLKCVEEKLSRFQHPGA